MRVCSAPGLGRWAHQYFGVNMLGAKETKPENVTEANKVAEWIYCRPKNLSQRQLSLTRYGRYQSRVCRLASVISSWQFLGPLALDSCYGASTNSCRYVV